MASPWQIEPELRLPTPRPVRRRRVKVPQSAPGCFVGLFAIPAALMAVSLATWLLLWMVGINITGTITGKQHIGKRTYRVFYRFGPGFEDRIDLANRDFHRLRIGDGFRLKVFSSELGATETPSNLPFLTRYWGRDWPSRPLIFMFVWAGFVSLMVGAWAHSVFLEPQRQKWLVENGAATRGEIEGVSKSPKNPTTTARYGFHFPNGSQGHGSILMPQNLWLATGDAVTVLYDPHNPSRHTVYSLARYEVARQSTPKPL